jgi:hypothetical protein
MKGSDWLILGVAGVGAYLLLTRKQEQQPLININVPEFGIPDYSGLFSMFGQAYQAQGDLFAQLFGQQQSNFDSYLAAERAAGNKVVFSGTQDYGVGWYKQAGQDVPKNIMDAHWDASKYNGSSGNFTLEDIQAIGQQGSTITQVSPSGWMSFFAPIEATPYAIQQQAINRVNLGKTSDAGTQPLTGEALSIARGLVHLGIPKGTPQRPYTIGGTPNTVAQMGDGSYRAYDSSGNVVVDTSGIINESSKRERERQLRAGLV